MYKKVLTTVLLCVFSVFDIAWADYITPEGNLEIADNIYARASVAREIKAHNIIDKVIELYNQDIKKMDDGITLVRDKNNCIFLYINTKGYKKNFINQMIIDDEDCLND